MFCEHTRASTLADCDPLVFCDVTEIAKRLGAGAGNKNFGADGEQLSQTIPGVADDRSPTSRCLEQSDARAITGAHHICPSYVQREALGIIELAVLHGRKVGYAINVRWPNESFRVKRACHGKSKRGILA